MRLLLLANEIKEKFKTSMNKEAIPAEVGII